MAARQEVTFIISARDKTRAVFRRIGRGIRRLRVGVGGLLAGGAFAALTKGALDFASAITGASARLDVTTDTLQGLKILGERLNIPFTSLVTVMQRIARNAGQALSGDSRMVENFERLGITFEELQRLNTEDLFFAVADAAADTTRSWRETSALIAKVGDTEAVALRGLLVQGGDALARGVNALKDADKLTGPEALQKAAEAEAAAREALLQVQKDFTAAMVEALPVFRDLTQALIRYANRDETFGATAFDLLGRRENVSGTLRDPKVLARLDPEALTALQKTAVAAERTANALNNGMRLAP